MLKLVGLVLVLAAVYYGYTWYRANKAKLAAEVAAAEAKVKKDV
jgi:uncharacterized protein YdgA (DUF945 family)